MGGNFGAADVMVGSSLIWAVTMKLIAPEHRATRDYVKRLAQRPAFLRASAD